MYEILKGCPHCGGDASLNVNYSERAGGYFVMIKCSVCKSQGKTYFSEENPENEPRSNEASWNAVKAWNMRYYEV